MPPWSKRTSLKFGTCLRVMTIGVDFSKRTCVGCTWEQLQSSSELKDPKVHSHWLLLIQTRPGFWKRLIKRARKNCILQRQKRHHLRQLHAQAFDVLKRILPEELFTAPQNKEDVAQFGPFGCMQCRLRCRSRAGEEAHAFKRHHKVSHLCTLCDHPTCPSCLKLFHTMKKLKAHLYYNEHCRTTLQGWNLHCLQCAVKDLHSHLPGANNKPTLTETCMMLWWIW